MILDTAGRAANLVGKLLTFSRSTPQALSTVDVSEIIKETIVLLNYTIDRRINLEVDLTANPTTIVGDPSQLQNVFLNLAINSSQAMSKGGTLRVSSQNLELDAPCCNASAFNLHPGKYLEIEIHDTGCGIPPEHLNNIFDPFFTTKEQDQGTGLGLTTVYSTVQQHNGSIIVYSDPGSGTTFQILLPLLSKEHIIECNQHFDPRTVREGFKITVISKKFFTFVKIITVFCIFPIIKIIINISLHEHHQVLLFKKSIS